MRLINQAVSYFQPNGQPTIEGIAFFNARLTLETFTVATAPDASIAGQLIYVSDESGGAVVAFADGTNWRRVTDRAVIS